MQARSRMLWYRRWRRRSLYSRVMCRPFRIHLLQSLQRLHCLIDCATKRCTVLIIEELVDMAGEHAPLVFRCGVAFARPDRRMRGSEPIGCRSWMPRILIACDASTITRVIVEYRLQSRCAFRRRARTNSHVLRSRRRAARGGRGAAGTRAARPAKRVIRAHCRIGVVIVYCSSHCRVLIGGIKLHVGANSDARHEVLLADDIGLG